MSSLTLIRICIFEGRTSHPSLVPLLLLIYILFLIIKKNNGFDTTNFGAKFRPAFVGAWIS